MALTRAGRTPVTSRADDAALSLVAARARIAAAIEPVRDVVSVALVDALGRVVAVDVVADADVPAHDNAAMDGYAVRSLDFDGNALPATLTIAGCATAGAPYAGVPPPRTCVRILTGAVMPDSCDAVVAQEDVVADAVAATFGAVPRVGANRRLAGEDLRRGAVVLARGRRLRAADIGLAASVGAVTLGVFRRVRVAIFSTGDELRDVGEPLDAGCIRDSNRFALIGLAQCLGVDVVDLGIVRDDPAALAAVIAAACAGGADAIVTSGGVSAGDADHTRAVMADAGDVSFWKLAVKPGRPMAFGRVRDGVRGALLFALPGNPVAAMVVFHALVRDALLASAGASPEPRVTATAVCDVPIPKVVGRTEFVRGIATRGADGWHVRPTGAQGSGILRSMSEANCLVVLEHDRGAVRAGDIVDCWSFDGTG